MVKIAHHPLLTPLPAGFDLETSSPVEVKLLLVLCFLLKALALAFVLPLKKDKRYDVPIHPETYRPRILHSRPLSLASVTRV